MSSIFAVAIVGGIIDCIIISWTEYRCIDDNTDDTNYAIDVDRGRNSRNC